ncbi:DUF896 domain-containing protein [Clostridiaceae bacterium WCA-383-APC-5B]|uniref:UPF0291 protein FYJ33_00280 n=2 Tax=Inconstantimicrobium porci TaxID=2652291 RepID=A0A7X2MW98_9CLOT|nr:DUF896 domain-containing protein [Inconstantimicrobium porci]
MELIQRINELHRKSKEQGLTAEEKEEQAALRRQYIDNIKNNVRAQLQTVKPNNSRKK